MAIQKRSPNRRKSVAVVTDQNKPPFIQRTKRRAHSDRLSPLAKARRLLAPRKSILKQSSQENSQDENVTQSMDLTLDLRKSISRRVSFAKNAKVRLFEVQDNHTSSTNASGSPPSSPSQSPLHEHHPQPVTDENACPGLVPRNRRRSSARYSTAGSEDMDLTTINPFGFSGPADPNTSLGFSSDDGEDLTDDAMDITEVIHANVIRKRSTSIAGQRQPLAVLSSAPGSPPRDTRLDDSAMSLDDISQDDADITSQSSSSDGSSVPMEFTVPLAQSLKPPPHHDHAWLALRAATHAGEAPYEPPSPNHSFEDNNGGSILHDAAARPDDGELDDAVQRIMRARASLPNVPSIPLEPEDQIDIADDFTDDSDSFSAELFDGNQTLNLTNIVGRPSTTGRPSEFEATMEGTSVYGQIFNAAPVESTPTISRTQPSAMRPPSPEAPPPPPSKASIPLSTVFQPPPRHQTASQPPASTSKATAVPLQFSSTSKPSQHALPSPTKLKAASPAKLSTKPKARAFSAAFAPPVTRPSPKKPRHSSQSVVATATDVDVPQQSADKTLESRPGKPSALRRPSGYFARRQSLGAGVVSNPNDNSSGRPISLQPASPQKKPTGLGIGHASLGSTEEDAPMRLENHETAVPEKEKQKGPDRADMDVQAGKATSDHPPSPTRDSPAPGSTARRDSLPLAESDANLGQGTLGRSSPHTGADARLNIHDGRIGHDDDVSPIQEDTEDDNPGQDGQVRASGMEQWRNGVQQQSLGDPHVEEMPSISISEFFHITGIKFMDEIAAPRRSVSQPARAERAPADVRLAEYAIAAAVDVPQLVLYTRVAEDLEAWMRRSRGVLAEMETEAQQATPELFLEYLAADDEGKEELRHQLTLIRLNARGLAKKEWYNWKLQWIAGLSETASNGLDDLEQDKRALEGINSRSQSIIPALEQEFAEVMRELEVEQAEVDEIEASDQEYLNELKASITEQDIEVDALRTEVTESKAHLLRLQERLEEIEGQKNESASAIAEAQRLLHTQKSSTTAEIFRLRDELEALEDLHMFRVVKVVPEVFEYIYASQFAVSIPCRRYQPLPGKLCIANLDKRWKCKDDYPQLLEFFLRSAAERVNRIDTGWTVSQIVRSLANHWTAYLSLRAQIDLLSIKYPVAILLHAAEGASLAPPGFQAKTMVMFPNANAKAYISFFVSQEVAASWPASIDRLHCEVDVAYGSLKGELILDSIRRRLSEATPEDCHACLLDACIGAQEPYL